MQLASWLIATASALSIGEARPLVFVLDGAGDLKGCSIGVGVVVKNDRPAIDVEVFPWSHGYREIRKDQVDVAHARKQGKALAERVLLIKKETPRRRIVFLSHSAGTSVALAATDHLPANTLERCVLLAPSVSSRYDLRPALRASEKGIDAFCSRKDIWALGIGVRIVGTADELHARDAAGRHGFRPIVECLDDRQLYAKLRQHFWKRYDKDAGHDGRHHGVLVPEYLRREVFPLFVQQ